LKTNNTLWSWGYNNYGQVGDGTNSNRTNPVQITGTNWISVSCGYNHTLGVKSDGTFWSWGYNNYGQLGDGTLTQRLSPVKIGEGNTWSQVACGGYHTFARKTDGTIWGWGYNYYGQLGDETTSNRLSPVQIGTGSDWSGVSCGSHHTIAFDNSSTLPTVTSNSITSITNNSAISGGNISFDGDAQVTARGVCWSTSENPTTANIISQNGTGLGSFTSEIISLQPVTTYFVRAYATNSKGTAYGCQNSFTTLATIPNLTTSSISSITYNSAVSGGNISSDGGAAVTARGVCWSTLQNPTTADSKTTNGSSTGNFASNLTGLEPSTSYYVRAYATNSVGTAYGDQNSFTTNATTPSLSTNNITIIKAYTAVSGGNISSDGGASVTARGVCWSTLQNPTTADSKTSNGGGTGNFLSSLTGLIPATTYYVRAYATNIIGTVYGGQITFKSAAEVQQIISLTQGWNINSIFVEPDNKSMPIIWNDIKSSVNLVKNSIGQSYIPSFNVNQIGDWNKYEGYQVSLNGAKALTLKGTQIKPEDTPISMSAGWKIVPYLRSTSMSVVTALSSLRNDGALILCKNSSGQSYIPAYNINQIGNMKVGQGYQIYLSKSSTLTYPSNDPEPETVTINNQVWTLKNLDVSTYRNGDEIPQVTDPTVWANLTSGAWCYYNNNPAIGAVYGKLYNWYAVNDPRGLAPIGYHIPSDAEWTTLTTYLGGENIAGGKMKESGFEHWTHPNNGGTNSSGFTGLPGSFRDQSGGFIDLGWFGFWWAATESDTYAWVRGLHSANTTIQRFKDRKVMGFSVRCIKD
jgi:uncharacterized protein (TIGR02145 family)